MNAFTVEVARAAIAEQARGSVHISHSPSVLSNADGTGLEDNGKDK